MNRTGLAGGFFSVNRAGRTREIMQQSGMAIKSKGAANGGARPWLMALLAVASLAALFGPGLAEHLRNSADPLIFADDVRQHVFAFYPFYDSSLFAGDFLAKHALALSPLGHRLVYIGAAAWLDPAATSKVLPYVQYAALLVMLALAAYRLGGWAVMWATLALVLSSGIFLDRMVGGVARSWAFPLAAGAALALVWGRVYWLGAVTVLGALFYPSVAAICGLTMVAWLWLLPSSWRGQAHDWGWLKRLLAPAAIAGLCLLALLPMALELRQYGPRLGPADVADYPELGTGGRYGADDRSPYPAVYIAAADAFGRALLGGEDGPLPSAREWFNRGSVYSRPATALIVAVGVVAVVLLAGLALAVRHRPEAGRLLAMLAAALAGYVMACLLAPHLFLPQRYLIYAIPVLTVLAFPVAVAALVGRWAKPGWLKPAAVIAATVAVLLLIGGQGSGKTGLSICIDPNATIYKRIAALPPDALLAGWPSGVIDNVPYFARRRALLTFETHQAFSKGFADQARGRMRAIIAAYFATEPGPLKKLRDDFGVDYLIVDGRDFGPNPPQYFKPFNDEARRAHAVMRLKGSEVLRRVGGDVKDWSGGIAILDLRNL